MRGLAVVILGIILTGCSASQPQVDILRANYAFDQGDYQVATVLYLENLDIPEDGEAVAYNLANVYYALGEFGPALDLWQTASVTPDPELLFKILFNKGVYYYTQGQYREARDMFIQALKIQPQSVPAKRNLELTSIKLRALPGGQSGGVQADQGALPEGQEPSGNTLRIFDYLRRREEQVWFNTQQVESDPSVLDW